jgi:hypothetical protein
METSLVRQMRASCQFYLRELPPLRAVRRGLTPMALLVIDGPAGQTAPRSGSTGHVKLASLKLRSVSVTRQLTAQNGS